MAHHVMDETGVTGEAGIVWAGAVRGNVSPQRLNDELPPLPVQPASAPSPSSADIVSVIALARVCQCVPTGE